MRTCTLPSLPLVEPDLDPAEALATLQEPPRTRFPPAAEAPTRAPRQGSPSDSAMEENGVTKLSLLDDQL